MRTSALDFYSPDTAQTTEDVAVELIAAAPGVEAIVPPRNGETAAASRAGATGGPCPARCRSSSPTAVTPASTFGHYHQPGSNAPTCHCGLPEATDDAKRELPFSGCSRLTPATSSSSPTSWRSRPTSDTSWPTPTSWCAASRRSTSTPIRTTKPDFDPTTPEVRAAWKAMTR